MIQGAPRPLLTLLAVLALVAACGQKGALYLPGQGPKTSIPKRPAAAHPAAPAPAPAATPPPVTAPAPEPSAPPSPAPNAPPS